MSPTESISLSLDQQKWLLGLARSTIEARLEKKQLPCKAPILDQLMEIRGAFVTLTINGALRGCIGHVIGTEPLWLSVRSNAVNAAFSDPRFPPLSGSELSTVEIEISALTPLWPVSSPSEIVIGRDGLTVERGTHRGLLLPQVAERYGWSPEEFLDQTCRKAGMESGCWRNSDTKISAFSAEVFSETDTQ